MYIFISWVSTFTDSNGPSLVRPNSVFVTLNQTEPNHSRTKPNPKHELDRLVLIYYVYICSIIYIILFVVCFGLNICIYILVSVHCTWSDHMVVFKKIHDFHAMHHHSCIPTSVLMLDVYEDLRIL